MLRRTGHIVVSVWLSLLLLFGGTAKEALHLFTGHTDTVHHTHKDGELQFETQHHHCDFLSFVLTAFDHVPLVFTTRTAVVSFQPWVPQPVLQPVTRPVAHDCLRGPPALPHAVALVA